MTNNDLQSITHTKIMIYKALHTHK